VGKTTGRREGPDNVYVNMGKTVGGHWDSCRRWLGMVVRFCPLTLQTFTGPLSNLLGQLGPDKLARNKPLSSPATRVGGAVQCVKNLAAKNLWHQRPKNRGRNVPVKITFTTQTIHYV
jgi:hypothetical protein